jgi:hypothetical protein
MSMGSKSPPLLGRKITRRKNYNVRMKTSVGFQIHNESIKLRHQGIILLEPLRFR